MAACDRQHSEVQKHEDIPPKAAKPEATEKEEGEEEEEEKGMAGSIDCMSQQQEEVRSLRARGAELEESLAKARSGLASAQERREFMQEEAEQARDYGKKLAQEMLRLTRIDQALPPDKSSSVEVLRRLVCTVTEVELQEKVALEDGRAKEAALRAEIADFTRGASFEDGQEGQRADARGGGECPGDNAGVVAAGAAAQADEEEEEGGGAFLENDRGVGKRAGTTTTARGQRGQRGRGIGVVLESVDYDPLLAAAAMSEAPGGGEEEANKGRGVVSRMTMDGVFGQGVTAEGAAAAGGAGNAYQPHKKKKKQKKVLEGKTLLAEGLHRIEAAHEVAKVEREETASRLSRLRLAVARRQREEDAAPGHAELLQYLLRFEELGRHALERERQLRKCQTERSALAMTREFLAGEARLLEAIAGGVQDASKKGKATAREEYLRQLEGIVEGVEDSLANQTRLVDAARSRRRAAEETRGSVAEERKRFLAGSKELTDECYRYEALNAHLALMRR